MQQAELVLHLIDSTAPEIEMEIPDNSKVVRILNKSDLPPHQDWKDCSDAVSVSCLTGEGMNFLKKQILSTITGSTSGFQQGDLVAINARHQHFLKKTKANLEESLVRLRHNESPEFVSFEIREALESVGAVVGKTDVEEILGSIFSSFCIGK